MIARLSDLVLHCSSCSHAVVSWSVWTEVWKLAKLKNAKCPVPVTMSTRGTLKLYPYDHGLDTLDQCVVTDHQVELDVELPDGRKISGLHATMGQTDQSSHVYLILPADPLSAFVAGQQQRPFRFAWADGKKPGFGNRDGGEPWKMVMTFQQELDGKATPELAKAAAQKQQQQQVRN